MKKIQNKNLRLNDAFEGVKSAGYSAIELIIVLVVISLLATQLIEVSFNRENQVREDANVRALAVLSQQAMNFYTDQLAWPSDVNTLVNGGYLPGFRNQNTSGNPFIFQPVLGGENSLLITTDLGELLNARAVQATWGPSASLTDTSVTIAIAVPGTESSHEPFLFRDGGRSVTGTFTFDPGADINVGNNIIDNVRELNATQNDGQGVITGDNVDARLMTADSFQYQ